MALTKKEIKTERSISLTKFLAMYCNICNGKVQKLKHKDIDLFNIPGVKKIPFDIVTIEDLRQGEVILVTDSSNNVATYLNPRNLITEVEMETDLIFNFDCTYDEEYEKSKRRSKRKRVKKIKSNDPKKVTKKRYIEEQLKKDSFESLKEVELEIYQKCYNVK